MFFIRSGAFLDINLYVIRVYFYVIGHSAKSNAFGSKATEHRKEILELNRKIESVSKNIEDV